jgi:hypothetical protein
MEVSPTFEGGVDATQNNKFIEDFYLRPGWLISLPYRWFER